MPNWIPAPRAWANAIGLLLLMAGLQYFSSYVWVIVDWLIRWSPRLSTALIVLVFLSPIAIIALLHHWLHGLLDYGFPESRISAAEVVSGVFPGVLSWWQGLYGWLLNYLTLLISSALLGIVLPPSHIHAWIATLIQVHPLLALDTVIRIVVAALLYQFEFQVQQRLMAIGASRS